LPLGSKAVVDQPGNLGKSVQVTIDDRGP